MSGPAHPSPDDSRLDRLADRAVFDPGSPALPLDDLDDAMALDLAAAAAYLAMAPAEGEPLPDPVRSLVAADAARFFAAGPTPRRKAAARRGRVAAILPWLGWMAAAASLTIVARSSRPVAAPRPTTVAEKMERLRGAARPITLEATEHPLARGAGGELVWSDARQEGYLRLEGLAEVDPRRGAYQLWIFDRDRDRRYPVDGGLFTVSDAGRPTVVPIRAAVPVREPFLFAVTLEPPGGVVVSDRKRIMLTGATAP